MGVTQITAEEVNERINSGEQVTFVDTRPRSEFPSPEIRLPMAVRAPADEAEEHLRDINKQHLTVTYDDQPDQSHSAQVAELLDKRGFREARPLAGGMRAWQEQGLPIERD